MIEAKAVPYEKKMTIGKVISFAFGKFFKEFSAVGQWLLLMLAVALLNALPIGLIVGSLAWDFSYMNTIGIPIDPMGEVNKGMLIAGCILMLVVFIFDIVFGIFSSAWFTRLGLDAFDGNKRNFGERIHLGFKDLWRLLAPVLLLSLYGLIVMIPYYITNTINTMNSVGQMMGEVAQPFSPLEMVFYLVGLIAAYYMTIKTSAAYGILLEDPEEQVMDAFKKSFAMTKGRGWRIVGYYIVLTLLLLLSMVGILLPLIIGWVVVGVTEFNVGVLGFVIILSILLYMLVIAFSAGLRGIFVAGIYKYLKIEHSEDERVEMASESVETPVTYESSYEKPVTLEQDENSDDSSDDSEPRM